MAFGTVSLAKALRTVCLDRTDGAGLVVNAGKEALLEKALFWAAARHVCLSKVGRTIEAIVYRS
jgi:hypothetical protein